MRTTWHIQLIFPDLITLIVSVKHYKLLRALISNFLDPPFTSFLLNPLSSALRYYVL
jgi:hypothetical protein